VFVPDSVAAETGLGRHVVRSIHGVAIFVVSSVRV
jgi:hypothetical protein